MSVIGGIPHRDHSKRTLHEHKDGNGNFWLGNQLIDYHLKTIGRDGLALYCVLIRSATKQHYPSYVSLAGQLNLNLTRIRNMLGTLYDAGLLTDADIDAIEEAHERELEEQKEEEDFGEVDVEVETEVENVG